MADEADNADGQIELMLTDGIRRARASAHSMPSKTCLYCGEDLSELRRANFCDPECRDGFEVEQRIKRIGGA